MGLNLLKYRILGNTGLRVSRLCFGSLTIGPLQADLSPAEGARILSRAFDRGVNFVDTAELYGNYPHLARALAGRSAEIVVATKSYAYEARQAEASLHRALAELNRDYIDVYLLHEQESEATLRGHWEALEYLFRAREMGVVRAVGVSTHHVAGVRAVAAVPEIDIIHPLWNIRGFGIADGTPEEMMAAIREAHQAGKGIYAMKALGGGHLLGEWENAIQAVLSTDEFASVAVGMQSTLEVEFNVRLFSGDRVPDGLQQILARKPRRLLVEDWCHGCGECVAACRNKALCLIDGRVRVNPDRCRLCSYCAARCPDFCIKVI